MILSVRMTQSLFTAVDSNGNLAKLCTKRASDTATPLAPHNVPAKGEHLFLQL